MASTSLLKGGEKALDNSKDRSREDLLRVVDRVIEKGLSYLDGKYTKNPERLGWARVVISAVSAGNDILRDADLEDLAERVKVLEENKS